MPKDNWADEVVEAEVIDIQVPTEVVEEFVPDEDIPLPEMPPELAKATKVAAPDPTVVSYSAEQVVEGYRIVKFKGRPMILLDQPFPHFTALHKQQFDNIAYPILGGVGRSRMNDIFAYVASTAEDLSANEHLICFGSPDTDDDLPTVWDTKLLMTRTDVGSNDCVWRSPYCKLPSPNGEYTRLPFIMSLAGGDEGIYDDIMQSLAPLIMDTKPDGIIWWIGDGANGKSTLMDAIYKIFPGQLASITLKRLTDGRDTPSLNGTLGNVVKESSEGRIDDTEIYKSLGTHENFRVHKFHSQDDVEIIGNLHHIFSANSIPSFNDKGFATQRRTFIVPFNQQFTTDPEFEQKTFTKEMFGQLIMEMCRYANQIKRQGYKYKWSDVTLAAKANYDAEASNAEEYAKHLIKIGVVGFQDFNVLRSAYENWCADMGYVPLGVNNLRRAFSALGFSRKANRENEVVFQRYILEGIKWEDLRTYSAMLPGLFTTYGFKPEAEEIEEDLQDPEQQSIGKW